MTTDLSNSKPKFYVESNRFDAQLLIIGIVLIMLSTLILGYVYSLFLYFIPFIYFNVLLTIGFGLILSVLARLIIRIIKTRNQKVRLVIGVITVLFAMYFQWIAYLGAIVLENYPTIDEYLSSVFWILSPVEFFGLIADVNKYGVYGLGIRGDVPINGLLLTLVWILELAIVAILVIRPILHFKVYPFSEALNRWYPKHTLEPKFESIVSKGSILSSLDAGVVSAVKSLKEGNPTRYGKISLYHIEGEEDHYICIDRFYVEKRGKGRTKEIPVVSNYRINSDAAEEILRDFGR